MSDKIESLLIWKRIPHAPDLINIFCTSNLSDNRKWHNSTKLKQQSSNEVKISVIQLFPAAPPDKHLLHLEALRQMVLLQCIKMAQY